jgi:hypothetical protein
MRRRRAGGDHDHRRTKPQPPRGSVERIVWPVAEDRGRLTVVDHIQVHIRQYCGVQPTVGYEVGHQQRVPPTI